MDDGVRDAIRLAVSGQTDRPVELTLGSDGDLTTDHHEDPAMPDIAHEPATDDGVDANQVIDRLARQVAELVKDNAVLAVLAESRSQRIADLEQAIRTADA